MIDEFAKNTGVSRKIILSDGSEWNGAVTQVSGDNILWITLDEAPPMTEVFAKFSNPANLQVIETVLEIPNAFYEEKNAYKGFTEMTDISSRGTEIKIRLRIPR